MTVLGFSESTENTFFKLFFCQLRRVDDGLLQKAPGICLGRGYVTGVCISLGWIRTITGWVGCRRLEYNGLTWKTHKRILLESSPWSQSTKQATKKGVTMEEYKNHTRTAAPVLKGTLLTNCVIPSRTTCSEITPTYTQYVHPNKETKKGKRNEAERKRKYLKRNENKHALRAQAESPQGARLLFDGTISLPMIYLTIGPTGNRRTARKHQTEDRQICMTHSILTITI